MKNRLFILFAVMCELLTCSAQAQNAPAQASIVPTPAKMALVTINWWQNVLGAGYLQVVFDTAGEPMAGLSEQELNKKFAKVSLPASPASIINFVVQNGYRVVTFTTTQAGTHGGTGSTGGGTNGYVLLCEQVK